MGPALGLVGLMIGARYTQITVFDAPPVTITPVVLGVIAGGIAWVRHDAVRA